MAQLTDAQLLDLFAQYLPDNDQELINPLELRYVLAQLVAAKVSADVLAQFAQLASPRLTGTPQVPTAPAGTDSDQVASTAFVQAALLAIASGKNLSELVLPQEVRAGNWYLTGNGIWEARRNFGAVADPVSGPNWRLLAGFAGQLTTLPVAALSDATDAGRAMLTALDAAAQRALVNNPKIPAGRYGNHPSFNTEDGPAGAWAWVLRAISTLLSAQGVQQPAAPTAGLVDDTSDTFSFLPNPLFPSFAQYKVNGVPGTAGAVVLDTTNSYVQAGRIFVKVVGAVAKGGLAVYVAGSGNVPDGQVLTNADPFTGVVVTPPVGTKATPPYFGAIDDVNNLVTLGSAYAYSQVRWGLEGEAAQALASNSICNPGNVAGRLFAYVIADPASSRLQSDTVYSSAFTLAAPANNAPTVTLASPQDGQSLTTGDAFVLNATPFDADGSSDIERVDYLDNGVKFAQTTAAPHTVQGSLAAGAHSFTARVYDRMGASGTSNAVGITGVSAPPGGGNTTPDPPSWSYSAGNRTLALTHTVYGASELEYSYKGAAYQGYPSPLPVDGFAHPAGDWRGRVKAAAGRYASAPVASAGIAAATYPLANLFTMLGSQSNGLGAAFANDINTIPLLAPKKLGRLFPRFWIWNRTTQRFEQLQLGVNNLGYSYAAGETVYFGPELGMADQVEQTHPGQDFYFFKFAVGATSITQWVPGGQHRAALDAEVNAALAWFTTNSLSPLWLGDLWAQGEADGAMSQAQYLGNLNTLFTSFLNSYLPPSTKTVLTLLNDNQNPTNIYIRPAQLDYLSGHPNARYVETGAYTYYGGGNAVHMDGLGQYNHGVDFLAALDKPDNSPPGNTVYAPRRFAHDSVYMQYGSGFDQMTNDPNALGGSLHYCPGAYTAKAIFNVRINQPSTFKAFSPRDTGLGWVQVDFQQNGVSIYTFTFSQYAASPLPADLNNPVYTSSAIASGAYQVIIQKRDNDPSYIVVDNLELS